MHAMRCDAMPRGQWSDDMQIHILVLIRITSYHYLRLGRDLVGPV